METSRGADRAVDLVEAKSTRDELERGLSVLVEHVWSDLLRHLRQTSTEASLAAPTQRTAGLGPGVRLTPTCIGWNRNRSLTLL